MGWQHFAFEHMRFCALPQHPLLAGRASTQSSSSIPGRSPPSAGSSSHSSSGPSHTVLGVIVGGAVGGAALAAAAAATLLARRRRRARRVKEQQVPAGAGAGGAVLPLSTMESGELGRDSAELLKVRQGCTRQGSGVSMPCCQRGMRCVQCPTYLPATAHLPVCYTLGSTTPARVPASGRLACNFKLRPPSNTETSNLALTLALQVAPLEDPSDPQQAKSCSAVAKNTLWRSK